MRGAWPLALAAGSAWAAALVSVLWPQGAVPVAVTAWVASGVLLVLARRRLAPPALVIVLAAGALISSSVAVAVPARDAVTSVAVTGGRAVEVRAVVTSKIGGASSGVLWFDADTREVAAGGHHRALSVPIRVTVAVGSVDDRAGLDLGAPIVVRGTAIATEAGERPVLVVFASRAVEVRERPNGAAGVASALRAGFVRLSATLPGAGGALLPGLAVGDTSAVDSDLDLAMKTSSLSHLTAVSGANCAIIVGVAFGAAALLGARRWVRVTVSMTALAGFVILVTPEPSVVRAAVMAAVAMLGVLIGRAAAGLSALCLGIVVILTADPWLALSLGFALSVAATTALLLLAPPLARGLARRMPRGIALMLAVPLAAQLACGPLLILVNPVVPLYGVAANLVAGPAAPAATVLGLAACLLAPWAAWAAGAVAWLAWLPATWVAQTALTVHRLPSSSVAWIEGWAGAASLALLGVCAVILVTVPRQARKRLRALRALALAIVAGTIGVTTGMAALVGPVGFATVPGAWSIVACDVGQGDALLIRSAGQVAIIDTGPDPEVLAACLTKLGIVHLDLAVLTHFDLDHVGGVEAIVSRTRIVVHGPTASGADDALLRRLAEGGAQVVSARVGMSGVLGSARWRVLWPRQGSRAFPSGNDASVVIDVRGGGVPTSVFLGDLSASGQKALAFSGVLRPPYDVVKVAHHGSADQDPGLYRTLRGAVAVVSVGTDNDYGHPRSETLQLLMSLGASIQRTDWEGLIAVESGPSGIRVWHERSPPDHPPQDEVGGAD